MTSKTSLLISYGAVILLLMQETIKGIIAGLAIYLVIGLFIFIKDIRIDIKKLPCKLCISELLLIIVAVEFYHKWITSSKIMALSDLIGISHQIIVGGVAIVAALIGAYAIVMTYELLKNIAKKYKECVHSLSIRNRRLIQGVITFIAVPIAVVCMMQYMVDTSVFDIGILNLFVTVIIINSINLMLYTIIGHSSVATIIGSVSILIWGTANSYVLSFRGAMIGPADFLSLRTAMNVIGNYDFSNSLESIIAPWLIMIVMLAILLSTPDFIFDKKKTRILSACFASIFFLISLVYASNLHTYHWKNEGAKVNGYILEFCAEVREVRVKKPEYYAVNQIESLAQSYEVQSGRHEDNPHIIVIMDESFSDLNVIRELSTNKDVMPFISSLEENTVKGSALVSAFGGNTANSEFEFLTSNTMAWLPKNSIPYQQYINGSAYSMTSYLESKHEYKTIAMHPYYSSGWNRSNVYSHFGFDECMFLEDFPQNDLLREYVTDEEFFKEIINVYENEKQDSLFLFGVSMQNHGGYEYAGEDFKSTISLEGAFQDFADVEQYLTCVNETDKSVKMLIEYFNKVDEPVVIVFFGDHLPGLTETFYISQNGGEFLTLENQQSKYTVPFFIWANYDIKEQSNVYTSLNYLSNYAYNAADIPLPPYNLFLKEVQMEIPAMNSNGYYSKEKKKHLRYEDAEGKEKEILLLYEQLQYNNMFDKEHRSKIFFDN